MGAKAALVKGGHLEESAVDVLFDGQDWREFTAPHFDTPHTHGTGCTLFRGHRRRAGARPAVHSGRGARQEFVTQAIRTNPGLGHGAGPLNHHAPRTESECQMKFAELLKAAIQRSEIPLRFEPGAEEAVAKPSYGTPRAGWKRTGPRNRAPIST